MQKWRVTLWTWLEEALALAPAGADRAPAEVPRPDLRRGA
jgi:hypothetical protein